MQCHLSWPIRLGDHVVDTHLGNRSDHGHTHRSFSGPEVASAESQPSSSPILQLQHERTNSTECSPCTPLQFSELKVDAFPPAKTEPAACSFRQGSVDERRNQAPLTAQAAGSEGWL